MRTEQTSGGVTIDVSLPKPIGDPFARALFRTEAELLLEEADRIGTESDPWDRSPEARLADAFVLLVQRIGDAVSCQRRS